MNFKRETYTNDMEILVTDANLVTFSGTVLAANVVTGDEHGKKYVKSGSMIDKDGNIVTEKQEGTSPNFTYSLSSIPTGVLYKTVDVTNGDEAGALIVEGYLRADRVLECFANTKDAVKTALPKITFR